MELLGIIKEFDKLGRIVIPKEMRNALKLNKQVEIIITNEGILLRSPEYILVKRKRERE